MAHNLIQKPSRLWGKGLVFAIPPEEVWAKNPKDWSPFKNNLAEQASLDRQSFPKIGPMWRIGNGSASNVLQAPNHDSLEFRDHLTISCWFMEVAANSNGGYLYNYRTNGSEFSFNLITGAPSSGQLGFYTTSNNSTFQIAQTAYTQNVLYHCVATYFPSQFNKIYLNGDLKHTYTTSIPSQRVSSPNATINIGWPAGNGTTYLFNGWVSAPMIWNRVLSEDEIQKLYEDPWAPYRPTPTIVASTNNTYNEVASGGLVANSSATIAKQIKSITVSGGVLANSSATIAKQTNSITVTGGVLANSSATIAKSDNSLTVTGGVLANSSATIAKSDNSLTVSGGLVANSSATNFKTCVVFATGGLVVSSGEELRITTITVSGGIKIGGLARSIHQTTGFPVLVDTVIDDMPFADIRFEDEQQNLLPFEIESFVAGRLIAWVKTTGDFYLYYNSILPTNQEDQHNTWDRNYISVYHDLDDSTRNELDCFGDDNSTTGKVNTGQYYATGEYTTTTTTDSLATNSPITLETWAKATTFAHRQVVYSRGSTSWNASIGFSEDGEARFSVKNEEGEVWTVRGDTTLSLNTWYYLAGVFDGQTLKVYLNGELDGTRQVSFERLTQQSGVNQFGRLQTQFDLEGATVDETRISGFGRSAGWIAATYETIATPLEPVGVVETPENIVANSTAVAGAIYTITASGGIGAAGAAQQYKSIWEQSDLGTSTGGETSPGVSTWDRATGGLAAAGAAQQYKTAPVSSTGGSKTGGSTSPDYTGNPAIAGGVCPGATARAQARYPITSSGGTKTGGRATFFDRLKGSGGVGAGSTAVPGARYLPSTTGGSKTGGAAAPTKTSTQTSTGGATPGGASTVRARARVTAAGGASTGGAATITVRLSINATGGIEAAATAAPTKTIRQVGSGGVGAGATATPSKTIRQVGSGGVAPGGAPAPSKTIRQVGSGGVAPGAAALPSKTIRQVGSGGVILSRRIAGVASDWTVAAVATWDTDEQSNSWTTDEENNWATAEQSNSWEG